MPGAAVPYAPGTARSRPTPVPATTQPAAGQPATRRGRGIRGSFPASFYAGAAIVALWTTCALFGPDIAPYGANAIDLHDILRPPSLAHPCGTDGLGRDVLSRVVLGAREILVTAPLAALLGTMAGTAMGLVGGYLGGPADAILARLIDTMVALPLLIVALLALTALGVSQIAVIVVIGLVFAPLIARTVRAAVRAECAFDYVPAAQLRGEPAWRIMTTEILPNVAAPILVEATIRLGYAIFAAASLSFLGFGLQPPSPDWGLAIAENYGTLSGGVWWTVLFDAAATASLVVAVNLVAEGLHRRMLA